MTNRKDMIDDALLRPGRLEVHLEISLPDEAGRVQILNIHTEKMRKNKLIDDDVDIAELAGMTKNFSGAELEGVIRAALSHAIYQKIEIGSGAGVGASLGVPDAAAPKLKRADFMQALTEVKPAYGNDTESLAKFAKHGIIRFSPIVQETIDSVLHNLWQVHQDKSNNNLAMLFVGPPASGKTSLVAHIAQGSDFPFIKTVSAAQLSGFRDDASKKDCMLKVFSDACKSRLSLVILDDLESLIQWKPVGLRYNGEVLDAIRLIIKQDRPDDRQLVVIATTSKLGVMEQLGAKELFEMVIPVPVIRNSRERGNGLRESGSAAFQADKEIQRARDAVGDLGGAVGVKDILKIARRAPVDNPYQNLRRELQEVTALHGHDL